VADWDEEVHPNGPVRLVCLADVVKPLVDIYDILWGVADKEQSDDEEHKNIDL